MISIKLYHDRSKCTNKIQVHPKLVPLLSISMDSENNIQTVVTNFTTETTHNVKNFDQWLNVSYASISSSEVMAGNNTLRFKCLRERLEPK